jgi:hypothetical protein
VISEATAVLTARLAEFTVAHSASRDENPCLHHRPCGRHVDDIGDGDTGADLVLLMLGHTCA